MSKTVSKGRIAVIIICLILTAAIIAGTFLVFRPYYYSNFYMAPNPTNLSISAVTADDAVYGDFYVSPNGSDNNSGTQEFPFATIEKAQEAVRKLDKEYRNHVVVALLAGTYETGTVNFSKQDSGTESCRIIYAACDGDVILKGDAPAGENFTPTNSAIIEIDGAEHLSFSHITVDSSTGSGIKVKGKNVDFSGCTVQNTAVSGIEISGSNISVINCTFTKTGSSAIVAAGGDTKKLTAGNIVINNNLIYSTSCFDKAQPAVILGGAGNSFTNNEIYNTPSAAVYYSGNLHKIEYNYIHNVLLESDTQAAVSAPQGWINYGNFVRYNCISTLGNGENSPTAIMPASGTTVRGNMIINIPGTGVNLNGERDVNITNNILINCKTPLAYPTSAFNESDGNTTLNELEKSAYQSKEWSEKLPECAKLKTDSALKADPLFAANPANSLIENNIVLSASQELGEISPEAEKYSNIGVNLVLFLTKTEIFTDSENGIYTIPDSTLNTLSIDFSNLPFDSMGRF